MNQNKKDEDVQHFSDWDEDFDEDKTPKNKFQKNPNFVEKDT